jgi:hypothetical protein
MKNTGCATWSDSIVFYANPTATSPSTVALETGAFALSAAKEI